MDNIDIRQLKLLRTLARVVLGYSADQLKQQIEAGELFFVEVPKEGEDV